MNNDNAQYEQTEMGVDNTLLKARHLSTGSTGTLWYTSGKDLKPEDLNAMLANWVKLHLMRTGTEPTSILVNQMNTVAQAIEDPVLPIFTDPYVLPNHYFLRE